MCALPGIHNEDARSDGEIQSDSSRFEGNKKDRSVRIRRERSNRFGSLEYVHPPIQLHAFKASSSQSPVDYIQKIHKLKEKREEE